MPLLQHLLNLFLRFSLFCHVACRADIHIPLSRRGGRFARHESANLTLLSKIIERAEQRYAGTAREVEHNRLVRKWRAGEDGLDDDALLSQLASSGPWQVPVFAVEA